ncbi:hypothetical protein ASG87_00810 [Frateuria sp. Soil773]|nr:hypothetical protein ASG87_00810 [Frateuria sp. Soil773]
MPALPRLALVALTGGLLLAGCADKPTRSAPATHATTTARTSRAPAAQRPHASQSAAAHKAEQRNSRLPDNTGIAACDDYLSSYLACHRAARIYAPDQLEGRYQAMRTSLLRDSQDPDIRPQLAARCNSLAIQLRQALHGKPCEPEPAAAASSTP